MFGRSFAVHTCTFKTHVCVEYVKKRRRRRNCECRTYSHRMLNTTAVLSRFQCSLFRFSNVIFCTYISGKCALKCAHDICFLLDFDFFSLSLSLFHFKMHLLHNSIFSLRSTSVIFRYISHYGCIREHMYWAVKLENRKCIKCKIAENIHVHLVPAMEMPFFCQYIYAWMLCISRDVVCIHSRNAINTHTSHFNHYCKKHITIEAKTYFNNISYFVGFCSLKFSFCVMQLRKRFDFFLPLRIIRICSCKVLFEKKNLICFWGFFSLYHFFSKFKRYLYFGYETLWGCVTNLCVSFHFHKSEDLRLLTCHSAIFFFCHPVQIKPSFIVSKNKSISNFVCVAPSSS